MVVEADFLTSAENSKPPPLLFFSNLIGMNAHAFELHFVLSLLLFSLAHLVVTENPFDFFISGVCAPGWVGGFFKCLLDGQAFEADISVDLRELSGKDFSMQQLVS